MDKWKQIEKGIYIVTRASLGIEDKPCDNAFLKKLLMTDERNTDNPANIYRYHNNPNEWYEEKGYFNHRVENGHICRDFYWERWVVKIDTLEELNKFVEDNGQIVYEQGEITIYDDFIE